MPYTNLQFFMIWWVAGAFAVAGVAADRGRNAGSAWLTAIVLSPVVGYFIVLGLANRNGASGGGDGAMAPHRLLIGIAVVIAAWPLVETFAYLQGGGVVPGSGRDPAWQSESTFPPVADEMN